MNWKIVLQNSLVKYFGDCLFPITNKLWLDLGNSLKTIGLVSLIFNKKDNDSKNENNNLIKKLNKYTINYSIIIGITIAIGEFGDKTFLASIGLRYTISSLQTIFNYRCNSWNDY